MIETQSDIRGFPDCMLLIEGARSCDQITDVIKTLSEGAIAPLE
ncbi:hypothetical protein QF001_001063 [Paraburkholderia youngii]